MGDFDSELESFLKRPSPFGKGTTGRSPKMPFPYITTAPFGRPERMTLGEELVRRIQIGEDPEEAYRHVLHKGTRSPGARKKPVMEYLDKALRDAHEEGRI